MLPSSSIDTAVLARNLLLVCLTISFGLVLGAANQWYPFTPTFTSVKKKWAGWADILRWALSGIFLFILPFTYIGVVLVYLSKNPVHIPLSLPSVREALKMVALICLGIPFLGFYDIWQAIVRSCPSLFYSDTAKQKIENRFSSAFSAGRFATLLLGLVWILGPIIFFFIAVKL